MKVIGITGGIGSGKSTIARVFHSFGIPVFDSDAVAKSIYDRYPDLVSTIEKELSITITTSQGVDLTALRERVFSDELALKWIESQVHPMVADEFASWQNLQVAPYVLRESAILFQTGSDKDCFKTIAVVADASLRIERVIRRSGLSRGAVESRMTHQWTDEQLSARADFVIVNNSRSGVLERISSLHHHFLGANFANSPAKY